MTTYTVHFRNDTAFAVHEIEADTPQQALAIARRAVHDDSLDLCFEHYDISSNVDEIAVSDAGEDELACWVDEPLRLRLAAPELLSALQQAVKALNIAPRFAVPCLDSDSYRIAALCSDAIAKATKAECT